MWLPRCLRPVGWIPEKMTMRTGEDIPPSAGAGPALASRPVHRKLALATAVAAASLLVVAPAPSYDPWAWLLWGREVAGGGLSTVDGPAFKPLPVAVCALLAPLGSAAPWLWVLLVRAAAVLAALLAFDLARRLAGGSRLAGTLGAAAVLLCGALPAYTAAGAEPALVLALALGAAAAWRERRMRLALACAVGCALLRVEAWPFVAVAGFVLWRERPQDRALLAALGVAVPAAWLVPALVALRDRNALLPAAAGAAWIAIVALMAQAGFSGEPRYALPGAALIALSGAVGATNVTSCSLWPHQVTLVALVALAAVPRLADLADVRAAQAYQWRLAGDLADAVEAAGGADAVLACGRPFVGRLRGPLMAYRMDVAKRVVEPDEPPRPPGMVFRSALSSAERPAPSAPPQFTEVARTGTWQVLAACDDAPST